MLLRWRTVRSSQSLDTAGRQAGLRSESRAASSRGEGKVSPDGIISGGVRGHGREGLRVSLAT